MLGLDEFSHSAQPCDVVVSSGQQHRPSWRAADRDVEVREANALISQPVEVRRLQHGVAVTREVAVALVIGDEEDDVGQTWRLIQWGGRCVGEDG